MTYRGRIGLFCHPPNRARNGKIKYQRFTTGTDIHLRTLLCGVLFVTQLMATYGLLASIQYLQINFTTSVIHSCDTSPMNSLIHASNTAVQNCPINGLLYKSYMTRLLLLSSDVELNPGPTPDTEQILKAIEHGNHETARQILEVKENIQELKSDITTMKHDIGAIKSKLHNVEAKQMRMESDLRTIGGKIDQIEYKTEIIESDVSHLSLNDEIREESVAMLNRQVHFLEKESKRCNLRIFGVPEDPGESADVTMNKIVNHVLVPTNMSEVVEQEFNLSDSLEFARRLGSSDNSPRMILARFKIPDHKFRLFNFRDILRSKGVRISNDPTSLERIELDNLKSKGKKGYIKGGKVVILSDEQSNSRVFKKGNRRSNMENTITTELNGMEVSNPNQNRTDSYNQ